jgi:hypothetical protein
MTEMTSGGLPAVVGTPDATTQRLVNIKKREMEGTLYSGE